MYKRGIYTLPALLLAASVAVAGCSKSPATEPVTETAEVQTESAQKESGEEFFNQGRDYLKNEDYANAEACFLKAADLSYAGGVEMLGDMYQNGKGVEIDYQKAAEWNQKAMDLGSARAFTNMGLLYMNGLGTDQDYRKALEYFTQAAEHGDFKGPRYAGIIYENGYGGVGIDYGKAAKAYQQAADAGDISGNYYLGKLYERGLGVEQSYEEAMKCYLKAADTGDKVAIPSMTALAELYQQGLGTEKDEKQAMEWYQKAADLGDEASAQAVERLSGTAQEKNQGPRMGGGGIDKSSDTELQKLIEEVKDRYQVFTFQDGVTGKTLDYNLFIPEGYEEAKAYPLVLFIPDSSLVGKGTEAALTQGYGGIIWASEEDQKRHPCFVLAPSYTGTLTTDNWETGEEVEMTVRLLESLQEQYSIDNKRIYATGQSMGCMTTMYLNTRYPELFRASLFVGGQWETESLMALADKKFFYVVAQGDPKASAGMAELKPALAQAGVPISSAVWNAAWPDEKLEQAADTLIAEQTDANFVEFELGSVLPEGVKIGTSEHMYSFDYAYKITALRDWLLKQ